MVLTSILILILFVYLVALARKRKWKSILILCSALLVVVVGAWYYMTQVFIPAFGVQCEIQQKWQIENYHLIKRRCIGFAGPSYDVVDLMQGDHLIAKVFEADESVCRITFITESKDSLHFDICALKRLP